MQKLRVLIYTSTVYIAEVDPGEGQRGTAIPQNMFCNFSIAKSQHLAYKTRTKRRISLSSLSNILITYLNPYGRGEEIRFENGSRLPHPTPNWILRPSPGSWSDWCGHSAYFQLSFKKIYFWCQAKTLIKSTPYLVDINNLPRRSAYSRSPTIAVSIVEKPLVLCRLRNPNTELMK